jgi:hypothetical protein
VTVTERTREIGIRKALGARDAHILLQFLVESVIMSGLGGLIGLGAGSGAALLIAKYSPLSTVLDPASALLSMGVAAGVGIFFGFYPAWRASRLDPISAALSERTHKACTAVPLLRLLRACQHASSSGRAQRIRNPRRVAFRPQRTKHDPAARREGVNTENVSDWRVVLLSSSRRCVTALAAEPPSGAMS